MRCPGYRTLKRSPEENDPETQHTLRQRGPFCPSALPLSIYYARYLTLQHVNLLNLGINRKNTWNDLMENDLGVSLSGQPFSTIHGDLITETTINREVKYRGGPMQGIYSTSEQATDTFMKTSHLMAKLRAVLE